MADADANFDALSELGIKLVGASADSLEVAQKTAGEGHPYPIGYGLDADDAQTLGAWTGVRQGMTIVNPCEFIINPEGVVMASLYATTQIGRMNPAEIVRFVSARK